MCEHGTIDLTRLRAAQFNRRGFLRATAASTLTLALGAGAAHAAPRRTSSPRTARGFATSTISSPTRCRPRRTTG